MKRVQLPPCTQRKVHRSRDLVPNKKTQTLREFFNIHAQTFHPELNNYINSTQTPIELRMANAPFVLYVNPTVDTLIAVKDDVTQETVMRIDYNPAAWRMYAEVDAPLFTLDELHTVARHDHRQLYIIGPSLALAVLKENKADSAQTFMHDNQAFPIPDGEYTHESLSLSCLEATSLKMIIISRPNHPYAKLCLQLDARTADWKNIVARLHSLATGTFGNVPRIAAVRAVHNLGDTYTNLAAPKFRGAAIEFSLHWE